MLHVMPNRAFRTHPRHAGQRCGLTSSDVPSMGRGGGRVKSGKVGERVRTYQITEERRERPFLRKKKQKKMEEKKKKGKKAVGPR